MSTPGSARNPMCYPLHHRAGLNLMDHHHPASTNIWFSGFILKNIFSNLLNKDVYSFSQVSKSFYVHIPYFEI
jgi:hypothetical protein